jgi:hypothetical protein
MAALAAALYDAARGNTLPTILGRSADIAVALLHDDTEDEALVDTELRALLDWIASRQHCSDLSATVIHIMYTYWPHRQGQNHLKCPRSNHAPPAGHPGRENTYKILTRG